MKVMKNITCVWVLLALVGLCLSGLAAASVTAHDPIRIDRNDDFSGVASSGNGTSGNPWIIEGLDIDGDGYGYCIYVGNTTDHFIIRNCDVHDAYIPVENDPYYLNAGIHLYDVMNGVVSDNQVYDNTYFGILLYSAAGNEVKGNNITSNECGIYLFEDSDLNAIEENVVNQNSAVGIATDYSDHNDIYMNSAEYNGIGYYINDADHNALEHNVGNYNDIGIYFEDACGNLARNNSICLSNDFGVFIDDDSEDNEIYHNNIANNTLQAYDAGMDNAWDDGYPSGGNYWSDYAGVDNYSGPRQDQYGSDGIGDTPYTDIGGGESEDAYPLMDSIETLGFGDKNDPIGFGDKNDPI